MSVTLTRRTRPAGPPTTTARLLDIGACYGTFSLEPGRPHTLRRKLLVEFRDGSRDYLVVPHGSAAPGVRVGATIAIRYAGTSEQLTPVAATVRPARKLARR